MGTCLYYGLSAGGHKQDLCLCVDANDFGESTAFKCTQTSTSTLLGQLEPNETYYWRVDEVNDNKIGSPWKGEVWEFKTATSPSTYRVWVEDTMKQIFPASRPASWPSSPTASISMASREYEGFQVIMLPDSGSLVSNATVAISDLVDGANTIDSNNIKWFQVGYVWMEDTHTNGHTQYLDDGEVDTGWWPDPLLTVPSFDIDDDEHAQPIWVEIYAPPGTPAGNYTGTLTISADDSANTVVAINVEVYDFEIPLRGHMKTSFGWKDYLAADRIGNYYYEYPDFMLEHRMMPDMMLRGIGGREDYSATPSPNDLQYYYDRGLTHFTITNVGDANGLDANDVNTIDTFLTDLAVQPNGAEIRDMGVIYGYDEKPEYDYETNEPLWEYMANTFEDVNNNWPDIETFTSAQIARGWGADPVGFLDSLYVDFITPWTIDYNDSDAELIRAAGKEHGAYVACLNGQSYANWYVYLPCIESRVIWWQSYQQKMDMFMSWHVMWWNSGVGIDPGAGAFTNWLWLASCNSPNTETEGLLIYRNIDDSPIPSIRIKNLRDGLEDYEYLYRYAQTYSYSEALNKAAEVSWSLHSYPVNFTHDPALVRQVRDDLANLVAP